MEMRDAVRARMLNQRLWGPPLRSPADVVGWFGAMQGQEYHFAKWSVAQRARNADEADVDRLLADGTILRTHVLRPTWHLVRAVDIRWVLTATAPRVQARNEHRYRQLELDAKTLRKGERIIAKALAGGKHLTRRELGEVLERSGTSVDGQRLAYIVMNAELEAVICSGARRGKQQTYALIDERAPDAVVLDPDDAVAELALRYLKARGPATPADFARWSSLRIAEARGAFDSIAGELRADEVDGRTLWSLKARSRARPAGSPAADLVQIYDEYVMGYSESRDLLLSPKAASDRFGGLPLVHPILLDGKVVGDWKPIRSHREVVVETQFYRRLSRAESDAVNVAIGRYGTFTGAPVVTKRLGALPKSVSHR